MRFLNQELPAAWSHRDGDTLGSFSPRHNCWEAEAATNRCVKQMCLGRSTERGVLHRGQAKPYVLRGNRGHQKATQIRHDDVLPAKEPAMKG